MMNQKINNLTISLDRIHPDIQVLNVRVHPFKLSQFMQIRDVVGHDIKGSKRFQMFENDRETFILVEAEIK